MSGPEKRAGQGRLAEVLATRGGHAEPEAPFVIEHREALIYMLCEAAELEHGIMCQYLFAAFSLKQHRDEGLTDEQLDAVNRWRTSILHVASEEMLHLALVHNLLSAIGSAPHLGRPNLPAPAHHYPAGVNLTLVPFGEDALRHFMFLERPEGMALEGAEGIDAPVHEAIPLMSEHDIVPGLQDFATVGHLYRSIEEGFKHLAEKFGEANLFIGPPKAQASNDHFRWPELVTVTDLVSAQQAIDTILEQGEGARGAWQDAHFGQFVRILEAYRETREADAGFEPVRPVMFATARPCEHDDTVPQIAEPVTARCVDLFNVSYEILLLALERYFAHTEESDDQLGTLAEATLALMLRVLLPLGNLITTLPVGPEHPGQNAGASFELFYESDYLMPHLSSAWVMLEERLRQGERFCDEIREIAGERIAQELEPVGAALGEAADSLAAHFADWGGSSRFATAPPAPALDLDAARGELERAGSVIARALAAPPVSPVAADIAYLADRVRAVAVALMDASTCANGSANLDDRGLAQPLTWAVLRPLIDALAEELPDRGDQEAPVGDAAAGEVSSDAPTAALAELAGRAVELASQAPHGRRRLLLTVSAATLERLALTPRPGAAPPAPDSRLTRLDELSRDLGSILQLVPHGPYLASDVPELCDWLGSEIPAPPVVALCRCGSSRERPWCDGACFAAGFDDTKDPERVPDRRDTYVGEQITVFDNRGICQHSGFCSDRIASVFHTDGDAFVTPSGGRVDEIIRSVRACPSGALSYALGATEARQHVDWDGARTGAIEVSKDGPYRVSGSVRLLDPAGAVVPPAEGASAEHYALCRCGHSRNKPYCSGMHWYVDFKDPQPASAATETIYEAAGGMPGLRRMTSLFYEKLAADDTLLAPLYATIPPSEPQRLALELAWLTGAPTDLREHPGLLPTESRDNLTAEARERWVELMCLAAQQAQLSDKPEFHATLRANLDIYSRADPDGDTSRFAWVKRPAAHSEDQEGEPDAVVELPPAGSAIGFNEHIKPMFRERDRSAMRFAFDLWSHAEVSAHAVEIAAKLADGTMPCDGAWPRVQVAAFKAWVEAGKPESAATPS